MVETSVLIKLVVFMIGFGFIWVFVSYLTRPRKRKRTEEYKNKVGKAGEDKIASLLNSYLDSQVYHIFNGVYLPTQTGTIQIDHIVVSKYGVFLIETKSWAGWIFGTVDHKKWTQRFGNGRKNYYQNPFLQVEIHMGVFSKLFDINQGAIYPVIALLRGTFKTTPIRNLLSPYETTGYIKAKTQQHFSDLEVEKLVKKIEELMIHPTYEVKKNHIENARQRINAHENS